jgi:hypothetical protein
MVDMEDEKKNVYAKFKIDKQLKIMDRLFVSESRETVDKWNAEDFDGEKPKIDKMKDS